MALVLPEAGCSKSPEGIKDGDLVKMDHYSLRSRFTGLTSADSTVKTTIYLQIKSEPVHFYQSECVIFHDFLTFLETPHHALKLLRLAIATVVSLEFT